MGYPNNKNDIKDLIFQDKLPFQKVNETPKEFIENVGCVCEQFHSSFQHDASLLSCPHEGNMRYLGIPKLTVCQIVSAIINIKILMQVL